MPIRWYHWLPTLGGRSVRPILDRIHETVIRCVGAQEHKDMPYAFNEPGLQNEVAPYTAQDFWAEMGDPKVGHGQVYDKQWNVIAILDQPNVVPYVLETKEGNQGQDRTCQQE